MTQQPPIESQIGQELEAKKALMLKEILNPATAGFLVVDMQVDFASLEGKSAKLWGQDISAILATIPKIEQLR